MVSLNRFALLAFVLLFAFAAFLFIQFNVISPAGQFTLLFACNLNGACNPGEDYANCPQDCCSAQCTGCTDPNCTTTDGICHIECDVLGTQCSVFRSTCDGLGWGATICYDADSTVQCCSAVPQDCSAGQFCSGGTCTDCSTVCDGSCESSICYGVDPDCDFLGNATEDCCGNGSCDPGAGEDCVSCPADCPGTVVCSIDTDCDDANAFTDDVCHNPGACDSYCTNEACSVACSADGDCDDTNSLTIDTCNDPGTCDASCSNEPCPIACDTDSACDDTNSLTIDICNDPGTCTASCSNEACSVVCSTDTECDDLNVDTVDSCVNAGTCSAECSNSTCSVECSSDAGCDDSDPLTIDTCNNPGACDASCSNTPCTPACSEDSDCDDANDETTDTCNNAGTCDASCSNVACTVACSSDDDCDDANDDTTDTCNNPGTCDASCSNELVSVTCSSDAECDDGDPSTVDTCYRPGTPGAHCLNEYIEENGDEPEPEPECYTDADCDDGNPETADSCYRPGTVGAHCLHEYVGEQPPAVGFSIEYVRELPESTERASELEITVKVLDQDQQPVIGATVSVVDANGNSVQLTGLPNGRYSGSFAIPSDYPLGAQPFNVVVEKEGTAEESSFELNVEKAQIRIEILSPILPKQAAGSTINFRLRLSYPDNSAVEDAEVSAAVAGTELAFTNEGNGIFTASYSLGAEQLGLLEFSVAATDAAGNEGTRVISLEVLTLEQYAWFIAGLLFLLLLLLIVSMLVLLFYMRFKHILKLERQRAKYFLMKKHAQLMISTASGAKKREFAAKAVYLDKLIGENKKSLVLMRRRNWLTLGDIPMDLYFGSKALLHNIRHLPSHLRRKKQLEANKAEVQKIDSEISDAKELIKRLENDFYRQLVPPDEFKKRLFDYREKIHLLAIKKKKLI